MRYGTLRSVADGLLAFTYGAPDTRAVTSMSDIGLPRLFARE